MRIVAVMKVVESGCVLPTSTCLIQVHNAQMVGEKYSHQFVHVEGNLILASTQSATPPMEFLFPGCAEESLHISLDILMDLWHTSAKVSKHLMIHMLMEFQLHLATQEIIFGHLLQHKKGSVPVHVLEKEKLHLHLSMGTTFVKLEYVLLEIILLTAIHYGMARAVLAPVPAVNSTTLHGSVSS